MTATASTSPRTSALAIALAFVPSLFALQSGQIGPILLLGAVLFLECERRGWPFLAGAATMLLAIKPHLAYLVWVAILFDSIARRQVAMIAGGILAGVAATADVIGAPFPRPAFNPANPPRIPAQIVGSD